MKKPSILVVSTKACKPLILLALKVVHTNLNYVYLLRSFLQIIFFLKSKILMQSESFIMVT